MEVQCMYMEIISKGQLPKINHRTEEQFNMQESHNFVQLWKGSVQANAADLLIYQASGRVTYKYGVFQPFR